MIPLARVPMFGFVTLAFLFLCVVLAFAVWFALRGTVGEGRTRVSGPAGCAIGCALLAIAGLGAAITGVVIAANLGSEVVRRGPFERLELKYDDNASSSKERGEGGERARGDDHAQLWAEIELRSGYAAGPIVRALREAVTEGLELTVRTVEHDGESRALIEVHVPLDEETEHELREFLDDLRADDPDLDLPAGIVLQIRGPND